MQGLTSLLKQKRSSITAAAAGFAAFVNIYALQSLLPLLADSFSTTSRAVSLAVSATTLAVALASPFCGWLVGQLSRGTALRTSVGGLCLAGLFVALSGSLHQLIFWRFVQGLFLPLLISAVLSFIAEDFATEEVGRATSHYVTWTIVGGFCGRWTAGMIAAQLGWRPALLTLAFLNTLAGAVLLSNVTKPESRLQGRNTPNLQSFRRCLSKPALRSTFLIGFSSLFTMVGGFTYVTFYLAKGPFNLGPDDLGNIFCVYLLGMAATPALGNVMPEWGVTKVIRVTSSVAIVGLVLTLVPILSVVTLGLGLLCVGGFGTQAACSSFIAQMGTRQNPSLPKSLKSVAAGLYLSAYYLGGCLGGIVPGYAWESLGWAGCVLLLGLAQTAIYLSSRALQPTK